VYALAYRLSFFSTSLLTWTRLYGSFEVLYKHCGPCPSSAREVITGGKAPRGANHAEPARSPRPERESHYKSYTLSGLFIFASPIGNRSGEACYIPQFHIYVKAVELFRRKIISNLPGLHLLSAPLELQQAIPGLHLLPHHRH
jgi:hypothetical protein